MSLALRLIRLFSALLLTACFTPHHEPPRRLLLSYEGGAPVESTVARPRLVVRAVTVPSVCSSVPSRSVATRRM